MIDAERAAFTQLCKEAEFFETADWAADKILRKEQLTPRVLDPCAGNGVLGDALRRAGYDPEKIVETDLHQWPSQNETVIADLDYIAGQGKCLMGGAEFSVFMNPPFSKATQFVIESIERGAKKIVMFQRFSFMESGSRREFWDTYPPSRVWLCGDRAQCWRADVPAEDVVIDGKLIKGRKGRSSPTAHAWFVWDVNDTAGATQIFRLYKE